VGRAVALALARDKEGVPVLIDLLPVLPGEHVGQVEEALYQLAGDTAPEVSLGTEAAEKKKCRDAWAAWWKANAGRVDLARLTTRIWYGYTLICDLNGNRVYEIDRNGKERWAIMGAGGPVDAWVLPGKRVLIAEYGADRITERDFKGNILFQKRIPNPVNVQRLPNGNTLVCEGACGRFFEVTQDGAVIWEYVNPYFGISAGQPNLPPVNNVFRAFRYTPEEIEQASGS